MSDENTGGQNPAPIADGVKALAKEAAATVQVIKMAAVTHAEIQVSAALPNLKQPAEKSVGPGDFGF